MNKIVFWMDMPSIHQSALLRALASEQNYSITVVVFNDISEKRKSIGWTMPEFGMAQLICHPTHDALMQLIHDTPLTTVHIFSGIEAYPNVFRAIRLAVENNNIIGIYSEARDSKGLSGMLRRLSSSMIALYAKNKFDFILAIGSCGPSWFKTCGYSDSIIYPFGYFVESCTAEQCDSEYNNCDSRAVNLCFIGQLIHRKGVDILIKALGSLSLTDWHLRIVGVGPKMAYMKQLCKHYGVIDKIEFIGAQANQEAMKTLQSSDLLVLPSRFDGWGAVVNEALMRGVPVICTDKCGSSDLIRHDFCGAVVNADSPDSLRKAIQNWSLSGRAKSLENRNKLRKWAKCLEGKIAARYLIDIVEHAQNGGIRPVPPWTIGDTKQ